MPKVKGVLLTFESTLEEDGRWVCVCKEVGTSTFGKNLKSAMNRLFEMTADHLKALHELDEIDAFFRRQRIKIIDISSPDLIEKRVRLKSSSIFHDSNSHLQGELTLASSVQFPQACYV